MGNCYFIFSYLADAVEALALTELVFDLSGTLFGLFEAAHSIRMLTITEADVAEVKVCTVEILQQLALSLQDENRGNQKNEQFFTVSFS